MCNAGKITLAGVSRVAFIVQLDVHGRYADCCLTVHGPGLLDNESLFLEQQREKRGEKWKRQYEESLGIKQREREQEVGEEERKNEKKKKKDRIDNHATRRYQGEDGKMLWATKQLISLNLSTLHNATAHYRPIRHYNALLTEVY